MNGTSSCLLENGAALVIQVRYEAKTAGTSATSPTFTRTLTRNMKLESGVFPQYVSLSHSSIGKSIDESEHLFIGYTFPMAICTKTIATMFRAVVDFVNFRTYVRPSG